MEFKVKHTFSIYCGGGTYHYTIKTCNKIHYKAWVKALQSVCIALNNAGSSVFGINKSLVIPLLEDWQTNPATGIYCVYCPDYSTDLAEETLVRKISLDVLIEMLRSLGKATT